MAIGVAGRIQRLAERLPGGEEVLKYLRSNEAFALMKEAIEAGRPPVVGITAELLKRHRQLLNLPVGRKFHWASYSGHSRGERVRAGAIRRLYLWLPAFTVGTTYRAIHLVKTAENRLLKRILDALPENEARWAHDYLGRRLTRR